ncbi:molybdopterin-dependent oxidoreductase [Paracoccus denitrificans]|jgi:hypothetical protein|uniref:Oxidoreductase molybdopterin-binding domain-containing protein n=2 Tax=Paracoccus denitrificans TaxID=266 RepID=A1BBA9_PARDP|nr:molybdopterin-dependent oxidoreductase [Paracoccus denitrificans]ABL72803.1 conserved hypothetical protein [Paracoccus denitrificans PD1222]MCU7427513.1 molybdopterin-dependent oxidoreductase [Paracoccus denitrificans]UFS68339.1 molybdopterin-dependent oxidoreductase [Paracoccus denitrificans]UPV98457.1 molybdopterin-dependent oxidoreductase [Paracoccus denitrificans]WQO37148.1 molybdopterin-dependent oxidoreductase [Paracoccus denitrificans]
MNRATTTLGRRAFVLSGSVAALAPASPLLAHADRAMLTITEPSGRVRELRDEDIAALPWQELTTQTRWTEGVQTFRGPFLKDVLTSGGLSRPDLAGRNLLMRALNDFGIVVPADDAWNYDPILAREMNGKPMRVRDKGPLWLVYPRDQRAELQNAVMDERWIWQLFEITVL